MHQKTYLKIKHQLYNRTFFTLTFLVVFLQDCSIHLSELEGGKDPIQNPVLQITIPHKPKRKDCYRKNRQSFLRICIQEELHTNPCSRTAWALLDSGSTVNLSTRIQKEQTIPISLERVEESTFQNLTFHPWKLHPPKYEWLLGLPFLESHCVVWEGGDPILVLPNQGKPCIQNQDFPILQSLIFRIPLIQRSGMYGILVLAGGKRFFMGIDTGSGYSSFPSWLLDSSLAESMKKTILYPDGTQTESSLYKLKEPIHISTQDPNHPLWMYEPEVGFPAEVGCRRCPDPIPVLGMDFLEKFRVYLDISSKIMYLEELHEKRKSHCRNERWGGFLCGSSTPTRTRI